jgi:hypothetical protein
MRAANLKSAILLLCVLGTFSLAGCDWTRNPIEAIPGCRTEVVTDYEPTQSIPWAQLSGKILFLRGTGRDSICIRLATDRYELDSNRRAVTRLKRWAARDVEDLADERRFYAMSVSPEQDKLIYTTGSEIYEMRLDRRESMR